jgi:hypothetical protein
MIRPLISTERFSNNRKPLSLREAVRAVQERLQTFMSPSSPDAVPASPRPAFPPPSELTPDKNIVDPVEPVNDDENSVTAKITQNKLLSMLGTTPAANESFKYRSKATITHNNLPVIIPPIEIVANPHGPASRS